MRRRRARAGAGCDPATGPLIVCAQAGNVNSGRLRSDRGDRRRRPTGRGRLGPRRRRLRAVGAAEPGDGRPRWRASSAPTRGRPTATSGSTCRTTRAWPSSPIRWRTPRRCRRPTRRISSTRAPASATRSNGCPSTPGGRADSRSTPRSGASAGRGSRRWSNAVARWLARLPTTLSATPGVEILNDVVLNQVLVRFIVPGGDQAAGDRLTRAVVQEIQDEGTIWLSGTTWHGVRRSGSRFPTGQPARMRPRSLLPRSCAQPIAGVPGRVTFAARTPRGTV